MPLPSADAIRILAYRYGAPIKDVAYITGFATPSGKLVATRGGQQQTRILFHPPSPPYMDGVELHIKASNGNANINGALSSLKQPETLMVSIESELALEHFLDWYDGTTPSRKASTSTSHQNTEPNRKQPSNDQRACAIHNMRLTVEHTVNNSNGQSVQRIIKNKELRLSTTELEIEIERLLDAQDNRCALSGIPLEFDTIASNKNLRPSLDRINSDGHYERGNLQIVCRFINFWKSDNDNAEFASLIQLLRNPAYGKATT